MLIDVHTMVGILMVISQEWGTMGLYIWISSGKMPMNNYCSLDNATRSCYQKKKKKKDKVVVIVIVHHVYIVQL